MATWTSEDKYSGAPSITYDEPTVTYDSTSYNYNGQLITVWTSETKS